MTMTFGVADAVSVAVGAFNPQILERKALLVDAHFVVAALGSIRCQTRIFRLKAKVNDRRLALQKGISVADIRT